MSFREIIEGIHRKDPAVCAGALAGADGLAVEEWHVAPGAYDLQALCAEMVQFFKEASRITGENNLGESTELYVAGEKGSVMMRSVTRDYLLLLVADPGVIPGKCRFLLRQGAQRARELL